MSDKTHGVDYVLGKAIPLNNNIGWICPKCGAANAPSTPQCFCNNHGFQAAWNMKGQGDAIQQGELR